LVYVPILIQIIEYDFFPFNPSKYN